MRQYILTSVFLCLVATLGACSGDPTLTRSKAGAWQIEGKTDRVSDKPRYAAAIMSRARNAMAHPWASSFATIQLLCFDNAPVVYFRFTEKVGSNRNSRLSYRFDQNPGRDVRVRVLRDSRTIVIENPDDVARFTHEMRAASDLIVQVFSLTEFMSTADFKVEGAESAIEAGFAGCPLPPVQGPRIS